MKTLLILGAGTGGTMVANKMAKILDLKEWRIIIVDKDEKHYYQPGFLFIPFGVYSPSDVVKPKRKLLPSTVDVIFGDIELIEPEKNKVTLTDKKVISYDYLVVASGSYICPDETPGLREGWHKNIFDFYTPDGAAKLHEFLETWQGAGREELIGARGEALADFDGEGFVFAHGERWQARSREPVRGGQPVAITGIDGLTLEVEPLAGSGPKTSEEHEHV